jgi:hypothetical protein
VSNFAQTPPSKRAYIIPSYRKCRRSPVLARSRADCGEHPIRYDNPKKEKARSPIHHPVEMRVENSGKCSETNIGRKEKDDGTENHGTPDSS